MPPEEASISSTGACACVYFCAGGAVEIVERLLQLGFVQASGQRARDVGEHAVAALLKLRQQRHQRLVQRLLHLRMRFAPTCDCNWPSIAGTIWSIDAFRPTETRIFFAISTWAGVGSSARAAPALRQAASSPATSAPRPRRKKFNIYASIFMSTGDAMSAPQNLDALGPRDEGGRGDTDKQAVLDDAGHARQCRGEPLRIGDSAEGAIQDVMAAIGEERRAVRSRRSVIAPSRPSAAQARSRRMRVEPAPNGTISTGSGKAPSRATRLEASAMTIMRPRRGGDDLFAQQRAAAALDEAQLRVDLVGAVDGQVELRRLLQRRQRNAEACRLGARRFGGRHADDLKTGRDVLAERGDEAARRGAGAEAKLHAGLDKSEGGGGGALFGVVG